MFIFIYLIHNYNKNKYFHYLTLLEQKVYTLHKWHRCFCIWKCLSKSLDDRFMKRCLDDDRCVKCIKIIFYLLNVHIIKYNFISPTISFFFFKIIFTSYNSPLIEIIYLKEKCHNLLCLFQIWKLFNSIASMAFKCWYEWNMLNNVEVDK